MIYVYMLKDFSIIDKILQIFQDLVNVLKIIDDQLQLLHIIFDRNLVNVFLNDERFVLQFCVHCY